MPVTQARHGDGGQVRAGGLAADCANPRTEFPFGVGKQPNGGRFAVVGRGGVGVLGRQTVADADSGQAGRLDEGVEIFVLLVVPTQAPTAAVDMEEDPARVLGADDAQWQHPARSCNLDRFGVRHMDDRPEEGLTGDACGPRDRRPDLHDRRRGLQERFDALDRSGRDRVE